MVRPDASSGTLLSHPVLRRFFCRVRPRVGWSTDDALPERVGEVWGETEGAGGKESTERSPLVGVRREGVEKNKGVKSSEMCAINSEFGESFLFVFRAPLQT